MNIRTVSQLALCLCFFGLASSANAQWDYVQVKSYKTTLKLPEVTSLVRYADLQLTAVIDSEPWGASATRFSVRTAQGQTVIIEVADDPWPYMFLYPSGPWPVDPSPEYVDVATELLEALSDRNLYSITIEDLWTNGWSQPGVYKVTGLTKFRFTQNTVTQYVGVETVVNGFFEDNVNSDYFGSFVLRRWSSDQSHKDITYKLAKSNNPTTACQVAPLRLVDNQWNPGLLDLIDSTVGDGAVEIDDYCRDTQQINGAWVRIVHRGSSWRG